LIVIIRQSGSTTKQKPILKTQHKFPAINPPFEHSDELVLRPIEADSIMISNYLTVMTMLWEILNLLSGIELLLQQENIIATSNCIVSMKAIQFPGKGFYIQSWRHCTQSFIVTPKLPCKRYINCWK
jgi:hypothetical protein